MKILLENNFNGLQHIGIPVTDIQRSITFYRRLGFTVVMEKTFPEGDGETTAVMMHRAGVIIELYQLPQSQLEEIENRRDGSVDHIAFSVSNIQAAFDEMKAAGEDIIEAAPIHLDFWQNGCQYFAIRGPDGEKLEFNQIL
ncbi:VOC family protein [Amphritea pacifica]|uniref:VOC family protein n=1 Tax=Amphritea pacifica TaxID=2811233 RepID=A0ABS2W7F3_9GAMM|nr:VOC family protein [Amphritea pacifica]MBN0987661.1 VOC family protein [Amphritea pacifica]